MFGTKEHHDGKEELEKGSISDSEDALLEALGYRQEFVREFTNLSTISFAFSIRTSIAEIVSAYPTNGGLYSASAYLVPGHWKAPVGWVVGWLNLLGQVSGLASSAFGLSQMIFAAVAISTDGDFVASPGALVGLTAGILLIVGLINSLGTRVLSRFTQTFVFINLGSVLGIVIALFVTTKEKHTAKYTFTGFQNGSGWSSNGLSFLLGLLSVQWTMTDYDATAHICEEVRRASVAAPAAIFVAVIGTGLIGWVYNIVLVLCSGPFDGLPGVSGYAVATILANNFGKTGFYVAWVPVCMTSFFVCCAGLQANARAFFAFSRDSGLPDRGFFAKVSKDRIPVNAVWLVVGLSMALCFLEFASYTAIEAIFALCAVALDSSYIIPIACKLVFRNHPDVMFKPGPFHLGTGLLQYFVNGIAISWTIFVCIILCLPQEIPVTKNNFNYASVITAGVMILSGIWWFLGGKAFYHGPRNIVEEQRLTFEKTARDVEH
ncbi:amino acid transmembrane transporter [Pseudohyphozyma bogoriensis]|nr:amino acid transmembrane transporter [Pseudohyphozyma bogoriensis]